jgi:hypothetical protein
MALMEKTVFTGMADRIAAQYALLKTAFDTLSASGAGETYYERLSDTPDPDVEIEMLQAAYDADQMWAASTANTVLPALAAYMDLISAFILHLIREGSLTETTWNAYCENQDVRVSDYVNQVHYVKYGTWLKARNVFCEDVTVFATGDMTGATTLEFTDEDDFGDGGAANLADGSSFAGTQLKAVVTGSNTIAALAVTIEGLDEDGEEKTLTGCVISGAPGATVAVGSATDRWVDVTDVIRVSGGANGDSFELRNSKERTIAL